jgi:hypothetical protein
VRARIADPPPFQLADRPWGQPGTGGQFLLVAVICAGLGTVVVAGPAQAASNCPGNHLCLYEGRDFTGQKVFDRDASEMHAWGVLIPGVLFGNQGAVARSSDNRSLGTFQTYSKSGQVTNLLRPQTSGNLANNWVTYIVEN